MRFATVMVVLGGFLAGCDAETTEPDSATPNVVGRYVLRTVDGDQVPVVYTDQTNFRLEMLRGVIHVREDRTFSDSTQVRSTTNGVVRTVMDVATGTYFVNADTLKLTSARGEKYFMLITDRTLTQDLFGKVLIYRQ